MDLKAFWGLSSLLSSCRKTVVSLVMILLGPLASLRIRRAYFSIIVIIMSKRGGLMMKTGINGSGSEESYEFGVNGSLHGVKDEVIRWTAGIV
jgi:hypothetical protein